jgi:hypothetical protein
MNRYYSNLYQNYAQHFTGGIIRALVVLTALSLLALALTTYYPNLLGFLTNQRLPSQKVLSGDKQHLLRRTGSN